MIRRGLQTELHRFLLYLVGVTVLGFTLGQVLWTLVIALLAYITWTFIQFYRLDAWIKRARRRAYPTNDFGGALADVADDVLRIHALHEKDRVRLQSVVTRVKDMTEALTDGVILVDSGGNIEWWNRAAEEMFGFQTVDLGHKLSNLIRHPRFVRYFEDNLYQEPLSLESVRRTDQHLQFQIHPFGQGDRLVVVRDITRVLKLEQMRKDFVANVSHELRTPLTVVRGYIETLADSSDLPERWNKALEQMQGQTQRMTALINDLITLAKLETDDPLHEQNHIHIKTLISIIVSDAKTISAERNNEFFFEGDEDLYLKGNERELRSAVSNLVFNAINYLSPKSKIRIEFEANELGAFIQVIDEGIGIDPKHIPRLTERFYRVDSGRSVAAGGTGLGLAIVKHILLRHDADLKVSSVLGRGSTFTCQFPLQRIVTAEQ